MSAADCLSDRRRYRVHHHCGFPLIAYPYTVAGKILAGFAAGTAHVKPGVERGQVITRCPECNGDLRMSWPDFEAAIGDAFRP